MVSEAAKILECTDEDAALYDPCSCQVDDFGGYYITCVGVQYAYEIQQAFLRAPVIDHAELEISMDRISALPVDLLVNRRVKTLRLVCPDRSSSIAVAADAFRASRNLTERLDIERCTVQSLAFLTDFVRLNALSVHDTAMTNLIDVPYLANLTTVDVTDNPNFSNWYYPSQTPSVTSITIKSTLNDMSASRIFDNVLYYRDQLTVLDLDEGNLTRVPEQIKSFSNLQYLGMSVNPIDTIATGALALNAKLDFLYLTQLGLDRLEPGALPDDYSTTNIHLSYNNLTLFDYATFHPVLDTMTTGFVELFLNPFDCGCSVAWLVRDCRDLLVHVRYATCVNGTRFEDLNPLGFADCPVECQAW